MNEVKKIAKILDEAECVEDALFVDFDGMVKALVNAGYGDVKQAVREFAEKMKERLAQKEVIKYKVHTQEIFIDMQATVIIDKLVKGYAENEHYKKRNGSNRKRNEWHRK